MRALDLATAATDELGGDDAQSSPFGSPDESELVAYMKKFLRAAQAKDAVGMAKAFKGAAEACDTDDDYQDKTESE